MENLYVPQVLGEEIITSEPTNFVKWHLSEGNILSAACRWNIFDITKEDFAKAKFPTKCVTSRFLAGNRNEIKWSITAETVQLPEKQCQLKVYFYHLIVKKYNFKIGYYTPELGVQFLKEFNGNVYKTGNIGFNYNLSLSDISKMGFKIRIFMGIIAEILPQTLIPDIQDKLMQDLKVLLETGSGADVTFTVNGQEINAHHVILSARSQVFNSMFNKKSNHSNIEITDFSYETIREMLHYIYTGKLHNPNEENLKELYQAGKRYALDSLSLLCQQILCKTYLDEGNALSLLDFSYFHEIKQLEELCIDFIARNMKIFNFEQLSHLKPELCKSVLLKMTEIQE